MLVWQLIKTRYFNAEKQTKIFNVTGNQSVMKAEQNCRRHVQQTAQKIYGVQRNMNDFLEESCIIMAPKWQAIVALVLEDCFSCKATIDDFSAYSMRYQQNRVF